MHATYATWEDTVDAIRPILARHGFSLSFKPGRSPKGVPTVTGVLRHEAGHKEEAELELPADTTGDKNAVQAVGSTMSYGQRYVAKMLLNLTSRGEDDDGPAAGQSAADLERHRRDQRPRRQAGLPRLEARQPGKLLGELSPPEFQRVIGHYSARLRRIEGKAEEPGLMEQRTPEWRAARLGKATGSRIADIVARTKSGYSTSRANYAAQLVCERLTGVAGRAASSARPWPGAREGARGSAALRVRARRRSREGRLPRPSQHRHVGRQP